MYRTHSLQRGSLLRDYVRGDAKLCNCAACGIVLLGASQRDEYEATPESARESLPELVAGRIRQRPYCAACLEEELGVNEQDLSKGRIPQLAENLTPRQAAKLN